MRINENEVIMDKEIYRDMIYEIQNLRRDIQDLRNNNIMMENIIQTKDEIIKELKELLNNKGVSI